MNCLYRFVLYTCMNTYYWLMYNVDVEYYQGQHRLENI